MTRLIVEADGGSRGNPGPAGYGAVVRDASTGAVLREVAASIGNATNNVAEYRGLIAGLEAVADIDPHADVDVRMDSKLVVEQMAGRWQVKHANMRPLAAEAAALVRRLGSVRFTHVPRERNTEADRLANAAMDAAARGEPWSPVSVQPEPVSRSTGWTPPGGSPTRLLLLRHGETPHSGSLRFSGSSDLDLTPRGVEQASRAAARIARDFTIDAVVASPLRRTRATAEAVAAAAGVVVESEDDLRETDFGAWEGLTFAEVQQSAPAELSLWLSDPDAAPHGGESFAATARRVRRARDRILTRFGGQRVLVVSHVTPIKTLIRLALDAPPVALFRMHLDLASLSLVDVFGDGPSVVRLVNDTAHLTEPLR